jgi:hypothetical protein
MFKGLNIVFFLLSHISHGFGGGPIICQFIGSYKIMFLSCCGTQAHLPRVAYSRLWGFTYFLLLIIHIR